MPANKKIQLPFILGALGAALLLGIALFVAKETADPLEVLFKELSPGVWRGDLIDYGGRRQTNKNLVLYPRNAKDAQTIFRIASRHKLKLSFTGAGHSMSGQSLPCADSRVCLSISTAKLDEWELGELERGKLVAGGGIPLAKIREFNKSPFSDWYFPVLPDANGPTVGGFIQAGGISASSFRFGGFWDNVLEIELVTPDGQIHTLGPASELFRYSFGGFGRIGLVTKVTLRLIKFKKPSLKSGAYEGVFETPKAWLNAANSLHAQNNSLWLMGNFEHGTVHTQFKIIGNPIGFKNKLATDSLRPANKQQTDGNLRSNKALRWLNLFCPEFLFSECYEGLARVKEQFDLPYIGIFAYKIRNSGLKVPLVHNFDGHFWIIGIWLANRGQDNSEFARLRVNFEILRQNLSVRRYLTVEEIPPDFDFLNYYGGRIWSNWQRIQNIVKSDRILRPWPPIQ